MVKEVQLKRKHSDNKFRDFDLEVCTIRDKKVVTQVPLVEEGKEKVKIDWI